MTAKRWWVRVAARWLARIDGVSGMVRLTMLGLTGISTDALTLRRACHRIVLMVCYVPHPLQRAKLNN